MCEPVISSPSVLRLGQLPIPQLNRDKTAPWVFISYSQTQDTTGAHQDWVSMLGRKLARLGVNVTIDNNVDGHESFAEFMDKISQNRFVICVCSNSYVEKTRHPEKRTGVMWEYELIEARGRHQQPLSSFLIPIIKDGSSAPFPNNIPKLILDHDILCHNFETEDNARCQFAKIIVRLLNVEKVISDSIKNNDTYAKYALEISDKFANAVAQYWCAIPNSAEEENLRLTITSGEILKVPQESSTTIFNNDNFDARQKAKAVVSVGRWDTSYKGDQEILSLLTGDGNHE